LLQSTGSGRKAVHPLRWNRRRLGRTLKRQLFRKAIKKCRFVQVIDSQFWLWNNGTKFDQTTTYYYSHRSLSSFEFSFGGFFSLNGLNLARTRTYWRKFTWSSLLSYKTSIE
jgi:hypothetical protein